MKKLLSLAGLMAAFATATFADPIVGNMSIGVLGTTVTVNQGTNTVSFSPVAPNNNAIVTNALGDYAGLLPLASVVSYSDFSYNMPINTATFQLIWTHANATFTLTSFTLIDEPGTGVSLEGTGIATLVGFDPTPGFWSFSASQASSQSIFTFQSTNISPIPGVPDSGTTALLLGVGLMGLGFAARRMKR